jgi:1-acyl-sn-glycerol-3-phosphate acyltransferase
MKAFDYSNVKHYRFAVIMKPLFKLLTFFLLRVTVTGRENIPEKGGIIVASNHVSGIDPMFVYMNLKIPIHYMSKDKLFEKSFFNWFYTHLNGFPVKRGAPDKRAVEYALEVVKQGHVLGIFPEGTRSKDGTLQQGKPGVALIARETKAGILPVCVYSQGGVKPFAKVTVRFGEVIKYEDLGFGEGVKTEELKTATGLVMQRIKELLALGHSNVG